MSATFRPCAFCHEQFQPVPGGSPSWCSDCNMLRANGHSFLLREMDRKYPNLQPVDTQERVQARAKVRKRGAGS